MGGGYTATTEWAIKVGKAAKIGEESGFIAKSFAKYGRFAATARWMSAFFTIGLTLGGAVSGLFKPYMEREEGMIDCQKKARIQFDHCMKHGL